MPLAAAALAIASLGDLTLQSGQVLRDVKLAYRTYGTLNADKSNAVLFPTWFNGTTEDLAPYVGPNGLVDDTKYFVITVDALANGVSTSPSNSTAQKGKAFPRIHIRDMVETEYKLVTEVLGIKHLYAVMGISMGGMQTFQWTAAYPDLMDRAVSIVGTPRMGEKDILLWTTFLTKLNLGAVKPAATPKKKSFLGTLFGAIEPALLGPENPEMMEAFAGADTQATTPTAPPPAAPGGIPPALLKKNPEDVFMQFEAMVTHDISKAFGGMDKAAAAIKAKMLVVTSKQDTAVSPELPSQFADMIKARKFELTGPCGHNAYKTNCEEQKLVPLIAEFYSQP